MRSLQKTCSRFHYRSIYRQARLQRNNTLHKKDLKKGRIPRSTEALTAKLLTLLKLDTTPALISILKHTGRTLCSQSPQNTKL